MDFFSKCDQIPADLVTFTEEILNGKLHFLFSVTYDWLLLKQGCVKLRYCKTILNYTCAYQGVSDVTFFVKLCVQTKWITPKYHSPNIFNVISKSIRQI